jgi:ABC-2 type transport system ATP-binding protein
MDIIRPDAGSIEVLGKAVSPATQDLLGYLPEDRGLYQKQRVFDVLVFLGEIKGLARHVARARAERYLDRVGLLQTRGQKMGELSKGMQQRVQIAAVLQHEPQLVVMDEPFSGLDPVNRQVVLDLFEETRKRGAAIILSTHIMEQVEQLCSRVLMIHQGRAVLYGTVKEIKERHAAGSIRVECNRDLATNADVAKIVGDQVFLKDGVTPEAFLAGLLKDGAAVTRFERALPSLNDVFVKAASS